MFKAREDIDFTLQPRSLQRAHEEAFYWFSPHGPGGLAYPRISGRQRTRNIRKSIFWFKEDAAFWGCEKGSVVRRARELGKVLTDAGVEIREIKTSNPGKIIWEDMKQILAQPGEGQIFRAF